MEENTTSLMDTKLEDLTVGDYAKINGIVLAATAGIVVALVAGAAAAEKVQNWRDRRMMIKLTKLDSQVKE